MKPVTIIGGGLAGLSLATGLARRNVPVEVHEAGSYPRHRVCGEFISGISDSTLSELGISDDLSDAKLHHSGIWFREGRPLMKMRLPEPARGLSRFCLDERLKNRVRDCGGNVITNSRRKLSSEDGIVIAAGRRRQKSRWIGLKCHFKNLAMEEGLEMHLGKNGYLGLAPVEQGRVNLCALFVKDNQAQGKGPELLFSYLAAGGHHELIERLNAAEIDETSFIGVSSLNLGWQEQSDSSFVIGDAGSVIPPFTGNGMSMAFKSAELALDPLTKWSRGEMGWNVALQASRKAQSKTFNRRLRSALTLQNILLHPQGQDLLESFSKLGVIPFRMLLSLVR